MQTTLTLVPENRDMRKLLLCYFLISCEEEDLSNRHFDINYLVNRKAGAGEYNYFRIIFHITFHLEIQ